MKDDCLFCQIAHGDKEKLVWENAVAAAFNDIHPQAPVHILVVPKEHVDSLDHIESAQQIGELMMAVKAVAQQAGVAGAYKARISVGRAAGQEVDHLHVHVLGAKVFRD